MTDYKNPIDKMVAKAQVILSDRIAEITTVANDTNIYDVRVTLGRSPEEYVPSHVSFSYDHD